MDEARAVLSRIERIEELDRSGAPPRAVLAELYALVDEAEVWARRERDLRAQAAAAALAEAARGAPLPGRRARPEILLG